MFKQENSESFHTLFCLHKDPIGSNGLFRPHNLIRRMPCPHGYTCHNCGKVDNPVDKYTLIRRIDLFLKNINRPTDIFVLFHIIVNFFNSVHDR